MELDGRFIDFLPEVVSKPLSNDKTGLVQVVSSMERFEATGPEVDVFALGRLMANIAEGAVGYLGVVTEGICVTLSVDGLLMGYN